MTAGSFSPLDTVLDSLMKVPEERVFVFLIFSLPHVPLNVVMSTSFPLKSIWEEAMERIVRGESESLKTTLRLVMVSVE